MKTIKTKLFGDAEYIKDDGVDFDDKTISLNNRKSTFTVMIFEGLNETELDKGIKLLDNLEELDSLARKEIIALNEDSNSIVSEFANDHFNEYGEDIQNAIFEKLNINTQYNKAFLENMEIGLVVVYEDASKGVCATIDYNLIWKDGDSFTDQVLAISFNENSQLISIAYES